jgi:hypothetical protein
VPNPHVPIRNANINLGLDASVQTLRTKLDRSERKVSVLEIEKKRLNSERDNMAKQLGVAFQNLEEVKIDNQALRNENDTLRQEVDSLRAENESLRDEVEHEQIQHRDETVQLRRQVDQTDNAARKENATLHAELARVRTQQDENTQHLARKDLELRKARKEQAEFARLQADHEALKAQVASLKAKRDEDNRRWNDKEAALQKQVERRDETIRHFQDVPQEQTNDAMRTDNDNLRHELAQLSAQQEEEFQRWARKEAELKRKVERREDAARQMKDMTREILSIREANNQQFNTAGPVAEYQENMFEDPVSRKSSYRREENTRTRIRNRVQQEVHNSRIASQPSSFIHESPRKSIMISRPSHRASLPADLSRSVSEDKHAEVNSDIESTTDLSLAPRSTPYVTRTIAPAKPRTSTVEPPAPLDLTELSFINGDEIAQLRRTLEEERAAMRRNRAVSVERQPREDTVRSERQTRNDTVRSERQTEEHTSRSERQPRDDTMQSVTSAKNTRRPSLPRKSSMKDMTEKTNVTEFEDLTSASNHDAAAAEQTQTRQSILDASLLSNTSRRRRSAPLENMTSAFIVPDIKITTRKQGTTKIDITQNVENRDHDNDNCTVCRRNTNSGECEPTFRIPKLVPVSSRMPDDVDATLRPSRSPKEALALVVKELHDERAHLHIELAVTRAHLENLDVSLGMRKRQEINARILDLLRQIEAKDNHIYNLYDVLEGQADNELTEQNVEDLTREIRAEEENLTANMTGAGVRKGKDKKVTIQSYIDSESENGGLSGDDEELPWEGFEDTESRNLAGLSSVY